MPHSTYIIAIILVLSRRPTHDIVNNLLQHGFEIRRLRRAKPHEPAPRRLLQRLRQLLEEEVLRGNVRPRDDQRSWDLVKPVPSCQHSLHPLGVPIESCAAYDLEFASPTNEATWSKTAEFESRSAASMRLSIFCQLCRKSSWRSCTSFCPSAPPSKGEKTEASGESAADDGLLDCFETRRRLVDRCWPFSTSSGSNMYAA